MDSVFFLASKLFGIALQVETWLVLGFLVAVLADMRGRKVLARTCLILSAGLLGIITIFPLACRARLRDWSRCNGCRVPGN